MSMKKIFIICAVIVLFLGFAHGNAHGDLPENFPGITTYIYDANAIADGYVFLSVSTEVEGVGFYVMILENDGNVVWYKELPDDYSYDFNMQSNGYLHYAQLFHHHTYAGGGDVVHVILDENFNEVEMIQAGNGYLAEAHDFQMLPNGNVLLFGYYLNEVDMSQVVPGGHPGALVSGTIVQELDSQRNVIFQWRTWDYHTFEDFFSILTDDPRSQNAVINTFHINALSRDIDGNIFVMTPQPAPRLPRSGWVKKINLRTGEIMYTLGGDYNEFSFVGVDPNEAPGHFTGHAFHRIPNGNVLDYDNGARDFTVSSRAHEYRLDEQNKIAEHVWTYEPNIIVSGLGRGNAQRLPNGNTMIGWGTVRGTYRPVATEVTPNGEKVWELFFDNTAVGSYRAFRFPYPPQSQAIVHTEYELATGNTYDFGDTGVTIKVISGGGGYNEVTVSREPYAPVYPVFSGKAPRALATRVIMTKSEFPSINAEVSFDAESFGLVDSIYFNDPCDLTVYHRQVPGYGLFVPLPTNYNWVTKKLRATMTQFGEFIFCFPDIQEIPYPPLLNQPESYRGVQEYMVIAPHKAEPNQMYTVNQELPISLSWSPKGFARWYHLQVATDPDFTDTVVNQSWMTDAYYIWESADPNTTYYYRVNTTNEGGTGDWSAGSFATVPPIIEVTSPNGGESWMLGIQYFIRWSDNIAEDVVLELYKDDTLVRTIGTFPSDRAYQWEVDLTLEPACDYSIKVKSSTDESLFDVSDSIFSIGVPPGDFDCDGCLRLDDLAVLVGEWLELDGALISDLFENGKVDFKDFAIFAQNWAGCP